jgi:hypothetical protein
MSRRKWVDREDWENYGGSLVSAASYDLALLGRLAASLGCQKLIRRAATAQEEKNSVVENAGNG